MDPTVTAAAIGVGGTVIVGVSGYVASVRNTSKTIEHDRENRVWERRADVYLEALWAVDFLQITHGLGPEVGPMLQSSGISPRTEPDWNGLDARMRAFASEPVWVAMKNVSRVYAALPSPSQSVGPGPEAGSPVVPHHADPSLALIAGRGLIEQIRTELQSSELNIFPKRRRFRWLRRLSSWRFHMG